MAGGYIEIGSGETYRDQVLTDYSALILFGGKAANITLNSRGALLLYSGSIANGVTINSSGGCEINNGAVASSVKVNSGGYFGVSGTTASAFDVEENGGYVYIKDELVSGYANIKFRSHTFNNLVMSDTSATVHSGTIAANTTVGADSYLQIFSGGIANGATLNSGGSMVLDGGGANNVAVNSSGMMHVLSGSANSTTVNSGGYMRIYSGGTATSVMENGGYVNDGYRRASFVSHTIKNLTLSGTSASVHSGTTATGARVNGSSLLHVLRGGIASGAVVNSGGSVLVDGGATVNNTTVNGGGYFRVNSGSNIANGVTVNSGGSFIVSGSANGVTVNCGNGIVDGGVWVFSGGAISGATVNSDGCLRFSAGCTGVDIVENGGYVWLPGESDDDSGQAYVTFKPNSFSGVQLNGKWATLHSGTTANETKVGSEGIFCIFSNGVANNTSVGAGGKLWIYDLGMADGLVVGSGAELNVGAGGWVTGRMTFESGANIVSGNYGYFDFDVRQTTAGGAALVKNLLVVPKTFYFSLTIDGTLANGTYKLATGAAGFDQTVWVTNIVDGWLGSLTVGGPARNFEGHGYKLDLGVDNVLSVTVGDLVPTGTKSDVDGNGISDVMFRYTGGDYQLGFWMNGTNSWKGNGLPHPAEWDVLGAYDMNSDGRADSVLVGNVVVNGVKGAYIGYYADSDDRDSNWVNIGYLTNEDNIDWKNKVGNLTGNSGKNSIVWYTYELGALGVWTDGTENWVSMGSGFDATWTLIGCGDFNGDGKDQVVMSHSGAEYHAIDIGGTWTNLGASDSGWEVRAIGDFSGDGRDDIVAFHGETGIVAMWGDGKVANWSQLGQLDKKDWFVVGAGDYNGDAKDDLLVRQKSTGMLGYYSGANMSNWTELGRGVDMNWTVIA